MLIAVLSGYGMAIAAPFLFRWFRDAAVWWFAALPLGLLLYFASLAGTVQEHQVLASSFPWVPELQVSLSFQLDGLSLLMALLITLIGALIVVYAQIYMHGDRMLGRLYAFLMMFMASMLGLVLSANLLVLFVFWELTTISSFFLIGYKDSSPKARAAARQSLLVTAGGGLALLAGIVLLGIVGGSYEIPQLLTNANIIRAHPLYPAIVGLVLLGACTKSAQFPFHFWLPNAMEAPTPVSAYLHSATMVKAGVYLLARLSPVLGGAAIWNTTLIIVGGVTLLLGGILALRQTDVKRLLAYTTICGLGILVLLIGVGTPAAIKAMLVFLVTHALYKGALFMVAGIIDHETGTREIPLLHGLRHAMPITTIAGVIAALSQAGIPLAIGFVAKETAYTSLLSMPGLLSLVIFTNALLVALSGVLTIPIFGGKPSFAGLPRQPHEPPLMMWIGPLVLSGISLANGLMPETLAATLISPAASAVLAVPTEIELHLFEGFAGSSGTVLLLSALTIAMGVGIYLLRGRLQRGLMRLDNVLAFGPEYWYERCILRLQQLATIVTCRVQNGYLRSYLLLIILTMVGLTGYVVFTQVPLGLRFDWYDVRFYEVAIAIVIVGAAGIIVVARSRLTAIIALGVVGYGTALFFLFFGGPDLALTQFAIETLSVVLFVLVLYRLPRFTEFSAPAVYWRDTIVSLAAGGLVSILMLAVMLPEQDSQLAAYFAENSYLLAKGRNVVNVILVDFRGFDTMGEIAVLGTAAIGIYALLKLLPADERDIPRQTLEYEAEDIPQLPPEQR